MTPPFGPMCIGPLMVAGSPGGHPMDWQLLHDSGHPCHKVSLHSDFPVVPGLHDVPITRLHLNVGVLSPDAHPNGQCCWIYVPRHSQFSSSL